MRMLLLGCAADVKGTDEIRYCPGKNMGVDDNCGSCGNSGGNRGEKVKPF